MIRFPFSKQQAIPQNVFLLGLVSFFNDFASEMVYPILPLFLTVVLQTPVPIVGLMEGIADTTASLSKYLFGAYSDYMQKRKAFVIGGYSFSAISKLLIGLATSWPFALFALFIARVGKGMRTAPRDSILLENTIPTNKGYIFGFHRAFDSFGAVIGPLVALVLLAVLKDNLRLVFFIAFIPACIAVLLLVIFVHEKKNASLTKTYQWKKIQWNTLNGQLKLFLLINLLFALGNSSDAFILLYAKHLGLTTTLVVLAYVLYNISQTAFAIHLGKLSDGIGAKKVYAGGLLVFSLVYFFFGSVHSSFWLWILFPIYGIYIAATDGVSKAYIGRFIQKESSGTYYGAFYTITALGGFFASLIGGLLWSWIAPSATFYYGSLMAFSAFIVFILFNRRASLKP